MGIVDHVVPGNDGWSGQAQRTGVLAVGSAADQGAAEQPYNSPLDRLARAAADFVVDRAFGHQHRGAPLAHAPEQGRERAGMRPPRDRDRVRIGRGERGAHATPDHGPSLEIHVLVGEERDAREVRRAGDRRPGVGAIDRAQLDRGEVAASARGFEAGEMIGADAMKEHGEPQARAHVRAARRVGRGARNGGGAGYARPARAATPMPMA
jgi:hypothetical protein